MIDTISISVQRGQYRVNDPEKFKDTFLPINLKNRFQIEDFMQISKGIKKYIYNPRAELRDQGIVYPNLTISERLIEGSYSCDLKVNFSAPKLLKGHSYWETTDENKENIIALLEKRLTEMGVTVPLVTLRNSKVNTIHYCINIPFPSNEKIRAFLERLSKTSLGKRFENSRERYSHDGMSVRFHTNVLEIVFYSKYNDALQKGTRSVDRRKTLQEVEIAKKFQKEGNIPAVLRIEVRFTKAQTIRYHLKNIIGTDKPAWSYDELFSQDISRKVIKHFWEKIISDPLNQYFLYQISDKDLILGIQAAYPKVKSKKIDAIVGQIYRLRTLGVKGLQEDTIKRQDRQAWDRKKKLLAALQAKLNKQDDSLVRIITDAIDGKAKPDTSLNSSEQLTLSYE